MNESLKDSLSRAADEVGSAEPDLQAIERRGRRRRTRRYGITGVVAVLVTTAVALPLYGLAGLGGSHPTPVGPGQIVRYDVGGAPQPIAAGGGAAWVSVSEVSSDGTGPTVLRRIDATTGAVTDIPGANGAVWPAAGPEGVWATCNQETCGPGVVELDPATGDVLRTIPGGSRLWQITTGLGYVWVTTNGTVGGVTRIDPESGEVVSSFEGRYNLVAVGGGSVWVTRSEGPGGVVQLDPDTGKVLSTFAFADPCYLDGTDTQVFVESCDGGSHAGTTSDELIALDARTGEVQYRVPIDGYGQMRVADGTLWIAENDPTGTQIRLVRLDPATGTSQGDPFMVARGSAKENDVGMLGPPSVFFATDGDSLWFTDFSAGQVIRVALPLSSSTPTADESSRQLSPGLPRAPLSYASVWSPDVAPFGTAQDSLAEAESGLGYRLYTPDTLAASNASLIHAWVETEDPGGEDMLPTTPQATVALAYSSGIQVTYVPWVYGVKAPAFSQDFNAKSYEVAASQHKTYSTATVAGVPVLLTAYDEQAVPGSVEFNLGSSNADAQTIAVIGNLSVPELEDVARSIIQQWSADHPDAA